MTDLGASDLRQRVDAALHAASIRPDVDAVVRRARELEPGLRTPRPFADDVDDPTLDPDATLQPFVDALRRRLDAQLVERSLRSLPSPVARQQRRHWFVLGAIATAAAAAGLLALPPIRAVLAVDGDEAAGSIAVDQAARAPDREVEPRRGKPRDADERVARDPAHARAPEPRADRVVDRGAGDLEARAHVEGDASTTPGDDDAPSAEAARGVDEAIAGAERRARLARERGDAKAAAAAYRQIVRVGGRRRSVELAYGELFALARQQGADPGPLWRAYLRRFPRGLYAQDAEAGLCRSSPDARPGGCRSRPDADPPELER